MNNNISITYSNYKSFTFLLIKNGHFEVTLCDLGASIYSIKYYDKLMTLTPSNKDDFFKENIYHGKTIGRVANRLKGNTVNLGGEVSTLANNEGENTLHGGHNGLSTKKFAYIIKKNKSSIVVSFSYLDPETHPGFVGNLNTQVIYTIGKDSLKITFKATSDKLTMCSLTNHAYFSLGSDNLGFLKLKINASKYLHPNPNDLLPLEIRNVDKVMDFTKYKNILKYINCPYLINSKTLGYDHYFYFDKLDNGIYQIKLKNKEYQLNIKTDYPGVQIYTDNYETIEAFNQSLEKTHRGIAIEPSASQAEFHYLDKGEIYSHFIYYKFRKIN